MLPNSSYDLSFSEPISRWDEALPLGNGLIGGLVWGDGAPLRISLDRADVWDLRPVPEWDSPDYNYETMRRWIAEGRIDDLHRLYEDPYKYPGPTKIPTGRLEITFPASGVLGSRLRLANGIGEIYFSNQCRLEIMIHAIEPVGYIRLTGTGEDPDLVTVAPRYTEKVEPSNEKGSPSSGDLITLGYPAAQFRTSGNVRGFVQDGWGGFQYALATAFHPTAPDVWEATWSVATKKDGADPWEIARRCVDAALDRGWESLLQSHVAWWERYWNQSTLSVPNTALDRQWHLETYKFGATARRGTPPITLQAVWTADDGRIPPWKGDYHHDLNTQLSYWPCYAGNRLEGGLSFLEWLWNTRDAAYTYTRNFWGKPGLNVPMTADLLGRQMGGWHPYTHSATTSAWLAHHFYLHWRYSMDRSFLRERAYPYLAEVAIFLESITELDDAGMRFLHLSSSPEINDNRLEAWLPPTSNYDLALIRWTFAAASELARELDRAEDANRWEALLASCPDLCYGPDDTLLLAPGIPLKESHRHLSHLIALHPLGQIVWEDGVQTQRKIRCSLDQLERLGPSRWCGYSYAWLGNLAARAKDGEKAERALEIFSRAFCAKNSFHVNGDQTRSGYSDMTYRPFTLEANFAACAGIQEMLLQSYRGIIRLFPAVPATWQEASFNRLRAEGAFLVSAERVGGVTKCFEIDAPQGGTVLLEYPFADVLADFRITGGDGDVVEREDGLVQAHLPPGATLMGSPAGQR